MPNAALAESLSERAVLRPGFTAELVDQSVRAGWHQVAPARGTRTVCRLTESDPKMTSPPPAAGVPFKLACTLRSAGNLPPLDASGLDRLVSRIGHDVRTPREGAD